MASITHSASGMRLKSSSQLLLHIPFVAFCAATVAPLIWIVLMSFRSQREIANDPFGLPTSINFENYIEVFKAPNILLFLSNSLVTVGSALLLVLIASSLAAYALARMEFAGQRMMLTAFIVADTIPLIVLIVPLYLVVRAVGIDQSLFSIIFPYTTMNLGVSVYILRSFFRSMNAELEEAARLDHCGVLRSIWHVVLPLAVPGFVVVGAINFISFWNEFFIASVLAASQEYMTLPAGLAATLVNRYYTNWSVLSAAVVLTVVPVALIFIVMQRRIAAGWASERV